MTKIILHPGDNRISLAEMPENSVDSVVCDPPYGLVSVAKRFGKEGSAPARVEKNDGSFNRLSKGFMGKTWDGSGIEIDPDFWALVLRVLKPGGYVVAFSSSRTYHRMACAIEDAGFITHPLIGWVYGQGFPKAHAADKAIDKMLGKEGSYDGVKPGYEGHYGTDNLRSLRESGTMSQDGGFSRPWMSDPDAVLKKQSQYHPATAEAAEWQGWAYGGQVRKPALEPIYVGQKPFSEKSGAANILRWGVGAVNVDGCRVATDENLNGGAYAKNPTQREQLWGEEAGNAWRRGGAGEFNQPTGRHPANLIHDGSPEVVALFPTTKSGKPGIMRKGVNDGACYGAESRPPGTQMTGFGDEGSAARFFESYPFDGEPLFYQPKAGKDDRAGSNHPTVKPIALMQSLVRHVTPPGGTVLDPFAGSGTTGEAALREGFNCILMEAETEYIAFLKNRFVHDLNHVASTTDLTNLLNSPVSPVTDLTNLLI